MLIEVLVPFLPPCSRCVEPAKYEVKTVWGNWAALCEAHKIRIGTDVGKILRVAEKPGV